MTMPPPPTGWTRLRMKSVFGAGRDYRVFDPDTEVDRFTVDGHLGLRPKAEVKGADGSDVYRVRGALLGIPKHMTISDTDGRDVASLKAAMFSPIRSRMSLTLVSGESWQLEGELLEKNYTITRDDVPIVSITQKWVTVRDVYTLDIADGVDAALVLAVMWAVDRWVEHD